MKNHIRSSDIYYIPAQKIFGNELFRGVPCPTERAYKILGDDGVQIIHQKFEEMLSQAIIRFGEHNLSKYAFHPIQKFADLRTNTIFRVGATINSEILGLETGIVRGTLPNLIISPELKVNDYALLKQREHYIIKLTQTLSKNINLKNYFQ